MNGYIIEFGTMFTILAVVLLIGLFFGIYITKKIVNSEKENNFKKSIDEIAKHFSKL